MNAAEMLRRAERGDAQAQNDVGVSYIWGEEGFSRDEARARHWYYLAAEQGHHEAQWNVCEMLLYGQGGPVDVERGLQYLRRAALARRWFPFAVSAAETLIEIYRQGLHGQPANPSEVTRWQGVLKDQRRRERGQKRKHRSRFLGD